MQSLTPASNVRPADYIPALDGLRGTAILMVLLWHYFSFALPFLPGWSGLDLFFVLSGYLITGRLIATRTNRDYFGRFYRNRALRILPLYFTVVTIFFAIIHFFVQKKNLPLFAIYTTHWKSFFLFTQNWTFIFYGFPADSSLFPLWSLAVEEQFYLIWPVIILLVPDTKFRMRLFTLMIILIMLIRTGYYLYHPTSGKSIYYNTFFRMDALIIGSLLSQLHHSKIIISARLVKWGSFILLIILAISNPYFKKSIPDTPFFPIAGYTITALFFACLLHLVVRPAPHAIGRFFNWSFLRFCGKISYGLYLFHSPVLQMAGTKMYFQGISLWPDRARQISWIVAIICLLFTFLISTLSYRYFESYFLRLKNRNSLSEEREPEKNPVVNTPK